MFKPSEEELELQRYKQSLGQLPVEIRPSDSILPLHLREAAPSRSVPLAEHDMSNLPVDPECTMRKNRKFKYLMRVVNPGKEDEVRDPELINRHHKKGGLDAPKTTHYLRENTTRTKQAFDGETEQERSMKYSNALMLASGWKPPEPVREEKGIIKGITELKTKTDLLLLFGIGAVILFISYSVFKN